MIKRTLIAILMLMTGVLLPALALAADTGPSSIPGKDSVYVVPATATTISDENLSFWTSNDGVSTLGMPVTSGDRRDRQIFTYGSVRHGKGGAVTRDHAGSQLATYRFGPHSSPDGRLIGMDLPAAFTALSEAPAGGSVHFDTKTMHSIKGSFATAYEALGGEAVLGRPISEAYDSGNMRLQWFQNAILQSTGGDVTLAPIGLELAIRAHRTSDPVTGGYRPVYLERYSDTNGDGTLGDAPSVFAPVAIQIPSIGVDATIENVPILDGVMQTPQDVWAVGWYNDLPAPGQFTNVVMAGHRDWWGVGPVIFYNLDMVQVGDMIYLWDADNLGATYKVTDVEVVDADINAGDVVSDKQADTLTLITCGGDFDGEHYLSRVIIQAQRI